jgi:hypothetical protein
MDDAGTQCGYLQLCTCPESVFNMNKLMKYGRNWEKVAFQEKNF